MCGLLVKLVCVVDVILGKLVVGLEIFNVICEMIYLFELLCFKEYDKLVSVLILVFGKDIVGCLIVVDLVCMFYLLVVGIIGLGKLVVVNVMVLSLLYKVLLKDLWMLMIDLKMFELSVY